MNSNDRDHAPRLCASRPQAILGAFLLGALLWLSRLHFPDISASPDLDSSWQQSLGYALVHRLQAGVDWWFTFGPFGYFDYARYEPALYWPTLLLWEGLIKVLLCAWFVRVLLRREGAIDRTLGFLLLLIVPGGWDAWYFLATVALTAPLLEDDAPNLWSLGLGLALLAVVALVKFTYLVFALFAVAALVARFSALRSWRSGARIAAVFALCLVSAWSLSGQSPWNLPSFLLHSYWIASGYSEAQARLGPAIDLERAGWAAALCLAALIAAAAARPPADRRWIPITVVAAGLYLAFKSGFVDHGTSIVTFFGFAAVAPFLASSSIPRSGAIALRSSAFALRIACAIVSLVGMCGTDDSPSVVWPGWVATCASSLPAKLRTLGELSRFRAAREDQLAKLRVKFDLPHMRERIGGRTVDQVSNEQGVLLLNRFHWHPRPVFQSYLAFTPELCAANGAFYDTDPPDCVIFSFETSDERLPGMEDNETLKRLWRDYRLVLMEKGFLLLERRPSSAPRNAIRRETVLERRIGFGETLSLDGLDGDCLVLHADIRYSLPGRLWKLLYKAPILRIETRLSGGETLEHRVLPGMLKTGVLVRPFTAGMDDCVRIFRGPSAQTRSIASFRIVGRDEDRAWLDPVIAVRVDKVDGLVPTRR